MLANHRTDLRFITQSNQDDLHGNHKTSANIWCFRLVAPNVPNHNNKFIKLNSKSSLPFSNMIHSVQTKAMEFLPSEMYIKRLALMTMVSLLKLVKALSMYTDSRKQIKEWEICFTSLKP